MTDDLTDDIIWIQGARIPWFDTRLGILYLIYIVYILFEYYISYILHLYGREKVCVI